MVGWHHWHNGHGFGWTPGVGDGQRPGVLQFMGSQRVRHDWATEMNSTEYFKASSFHYLAGNQIKFQISLNGIKM